MLRTRLAKAAAVTTLALAAITPVLAGQSAAATAADETRITATTGWQTAPVGKLTTG
ncbi:hypothetical protein [Streptomyces sp. NBC_01244]|uniref:hypothetical protein n=1 Tax=Streptomyces sp. NBC_01244 TaxID=2903797 RepID=UPI002E0E28F6|nr:hypothetical protein OG247_19155 [Streptomyces sp. NBC_01244]